MIINLTYLELILIISLIIIYGVFVAIQRINEDKNTDETQKVFLFFICIICSPIIFIARIIQGIFHNFKNQ